MRWLWSAGCVVLLWNLSMNTFGPICPKLSFWYNIRQSTVSTTEITLATYCHISTYFKINRTDMSKGHYCQIALHVLRCDKATPDRAHCSDWELWTWRCWGRYARCLASLSEAAVQESLTYNIISFLHTFSRICCKHFIVEQVSGSSLERLGSTVRLAVA